MTSSASTAGLHPLVIQWGKSCRETTARKPGGFFVGRDYRTANKARRSNASALATSNAGFLAMSQQKSCMVLSWNPLPCRQVIVRKDRGNVN